MRAKYKKQRGGTSILAVFFVILFAVLALSFTAMSNVNVQMSRNHHHMAAARATAESGLQYADLIIGSYIRDEQPYTFGKSLTASDMMAVFTEFSDYAASLLDGSLAIDEAGITPLMGFNEAGLLGRQFSVPVIQVDPDHRGQFSLRFRQYQDTPEFVEVISEGTLGDIRRKVQLNHDIIKEPLTLFDFALFARESLTLNHNVTVDGYNFDIDDDPLQIGANGINPGDININSASIVGGDVLVGPGGDPAEVIQMGAGASIDGDTYNMDQEWVPPMLQVPAALSSGPSLGTISDTTTITTSGKYDSIDMGKDKILRIDSDVVLYVTGDMILGNSSQLEITPTGSLTLFLAGNLTTSINVQMNSSGGDASKLIILGLDTCQTVEFNHSGLVYASLYVPDAEVDFNKAVELYGSVVATNFRQHESANLHYDANLRDLDLEGVSSYISITRDGNSFVEF